MNAPAGHSLRRRLLWLLLAAILLTALVQAMSAYRTARAEADEIFDYHMQRTAMALRQGLPLSGWADPRDSQLDGQSTEFVVQVWNADGLRLFQSARRAGLPDHAVLGFSTLQANGSTYRVFSVASSSQVIQVAQDMAVRREMAGKLALRTIAPIAAAAPLLMLVAWWVVSSSLSPVARVRRQVAERQADQLAEVSEAGLPDEIRPLVHELNLLFGRVRQAFEAQKNFVADAAHELRSPLAALKLQVQGLQRAGDDAARELAVGRLAAGIDRASRLVEQLLVLARQQANAASGAPPQPVALGEIVRLAAADVAPDAQARGIELGLSQDEPPAGAEVVGHPDALRILARNLIDNAVKYTPPGGKVEVTVRRVGELWMLAVDDSGPGIAEPDRQRVLDRFYRVAGSPTTGSGLGLAIVRAIAELHGARVSLANSAALGGLRAEVVFPTRR